MEELTAFAQTSTNNILRGFALSCFFMQLSREELEGIYYIQEASD